MLVAKNRGLQFSSELCLNLDNSSTHVRTGIRSYLAGCAARIIDHGVLFQCTRTLERSARLTTSAGTVNAPKNAPFARSVAPNSRQAVIIIVVQAAFRPRLKAAMRMGKGRR
jgi:hypothetical protein